LLGEIHQILLNDFSMQMSPKTVNYGGKNLDFGVGFGYRNNTTFLPLFCRQKGQLIRRPDYKVCSYSLASAYFKAMFLAFIKAIVSNAYSMSLLCAFFSNFVNK